MTFAKARIQVARERRQDAIRDLKDEIARLRTKAEEMRRMDNERCAAWHFPFRDKARADGVLECKAGTYVGAAHAAAKRLAELTGVSVSFEFNDEVLTETP